MEGLDVVWRDGRLADRREPAIGVGDSAWAEGRGCYTSVRIQGGRARHRERHVRRLQRGARALRLGCLDPELVRHALRDLSRAAFPEGEGVIRVQISRDGEGPPRVIAVPRALGVDPRVWSVVTSAIPHEGPIVAGGHKLTHRLVHALAADAAREAGADDALLFDREGRLVEAARSNVFAVDARGELLTPPLERGAVAGIARELIRERVADLRERDLDAARLRAARAVFCTNAVRGVRRVGRWDGMPLGAGDPPWQSRLEAALAEG